MKTRKQEINDLLKIENLIDFNQTISIEDKTFEKLLFIYSIGMNKLKTKIETLKYKFRILYQYDLINNINTRIKDPKGIIEKMQKKKYNLTYKDMIHNINDIAGIRIICLLKEDIFLIKNLIKKLPEICVLKEKDYVTYPKKSGYSSYHLIVEVPIHLFQNLIYVKAEIQIRTIAMDFWANLEHKMVYKPDKSLDMKITEKWENVLKL